MTRYWGIRTAKDSEQHEMVSSWLSQGVLRQGWGSEDLREVGRKVREGSTDPGLKSVWKLTQRMLDIGVGDIIVTPHQPSSNREGIWRVKGPYRFDRLEEGIGAGDFGNVIDVEFIKEFDRRDARLSSSLRKALTTGFRRRMRQLDVVGEEIQAIIDSEHDYSFSDAADHFEEVRKNARKALLDALLTQYGNADFERPIGALLESIYSKEAVIPTGGAGEKGRDFVVEEVDKLGLSRSIIVQVKSWSGCVGDGDLRHGLNQLRRGVDAQGGASSVDLAVLLTLAEEFPADLDLRIAELEDENGVRAVVMGADETLDLMLDQISEMSIGSA